MNIKSNRSIWEFSIEWRISNTMDVRACANIIYASEYNEIEYLSKVSGIESVTRYDGETPRRSFIKVSEGEDSNKLSLLLDGIKELYKIDLKGSSIVKNDVREMFRIRKKRSFNKDAINNSNYLLIYSSKDTIGSLCTSEKDNYKKGIYYLENSTYLKNKSKFGMIIYQNSFGVSKEFKQELESHKLKGLKFIKTHIKTTSKNQKKEIWILSSDIVLPRSNTPFVKANGSIKEPYDNWDDQWEWATFYDDGYEPYSLTYDSLPDLDIAITAEKVGSNYREFPAVLVSQKFKKILDDLKIKNTYSPIKIKKV